MTYAFNLSQLATKVNTSGQLSLTTGVTGVLPQANGGTGNSSLAAVAVTNLVAGTGISLSGSVGSVTITNTGGAGGATTSTSSADITLTNASNRVQSIAMTTYGKRVILPDATTISTLGGPLFIIVNNGSYVFDVCTSDGYSLGYLRPSNSMSVALSSSASANANWIVDSTGLASITSTLATSSGLQVSTATTATTGSVGKYVISVDTLSSTSVIIAYIDRATSDLYAVVATISGTTISYGTPVAVNVGTNIYAKVVALSSTAAFIMTENNTAATISTYAAVISGTTITLSPVASLSGQIQFACKVDSSRIVQFYNNGSGTVYIRALSHNGTSAITVGAAVSFSADAGTSGLLSDVYSAVTITTNTVACFYESDSLSTAYAYARIATLSGTTITLGTAVYLTWFGAGGGGGSKAAYYYSASECGFFTASMPDPNGADSIYSVPCTVSGTAITFGTPSAIYMPFTINNNFLSDFQFTQLDSTTGIIYNTRFNYAIKVKYVPTIGWNYAGIVSASNSPLGLAGCTLSSTSAFIIGEGTFGTNGLSLPTPSLMYASLLKTPT